MSIELVFISHNRLRYTRLALESVLASADETFRLTIWDNGSSDGTPEYLSSISDARVSDVVLSKENVGQIAAVNHVWSRSSADLVGKLDNDCLVTPGWTTQLAKAHEDIGMLGVVACWHFPISDFDYQRAQWKIQQFGSHRIFRHPWTCGSGLLIKREAYDYLGKVPERTQATTRYWIDMALKGFINGFYYPLVPQEHMDDPRSAYSSLIDTNAIKEARNVTVGLKRHGIRTLEERLLFRQDVIDNLLDGPIDPRAYTGLRGKFRHLSKRLTRSIRASRINRRSGSTSS